MDNLSIDLRTPISSFPLPQASTGDADNILVKADGNELRVSVSWTLTDQTSSVVTADGGGTVIPTSSYSGGSVDTADEQAKFLVEDFQSLGVEYKYQIIIGNSAISRFGSIESISLVKSGQTPVTWKASLTFLAGDVSTITA